MKFSSAHTLRTSNAREGEASNERQQPVASVGFRASQQRSGVLAGHSPSGRWSKGHEYPRRSELATRIENCRLTALPSARFSTWVHSSSGSRTRTDSSRRGKPPCDEADSRMQYAPGARHPSLYLIAAMRTVQTPFAEVLTVVRQQPVSVLAHPGARPLDHFSTRESRWRIGSDPDRATAGETIESCFFHRASAQAVCESRVVHDPAAANVDSVMQISATRCDNV